MAPSVSVPPSTQHVTRTRPSDFHLWNVEEKLSHVRRVLGRLPTQDGAHAAAKAPDHTPGQSGLTTASTSALTESAQPLPHSAAEHAVWLLNKTAVALATCGVFVLGWSWLTPRPDLLGSAWATFSLGTLAAMAAWCLSLMGREPMRH